MSEKLTNVLGYLTLFAILGAIWVLFGEDPSREQGARGERTFAGLEERINEVASVEIKQGMQTATIVRKNDKWQMNERGGYAVELEKVRSMLRGAAFSVRREPKTTNTSRLVRLGLGSDAMHISLFDDTGGLIMNFDMGDRRAGPDGRSLTYVMQERDTRAWLVTNLSETKADPGWWLERPLLSLNPKRFSDVIIGGAWLTRKLGDQNFRLQGKRGHETAAAAWQLAEPARLVSEMGFADVRALANPLSEAISVVELSTYDGLSIKLSLYDFDGGVWAQLNAEFDIALQNEGTGGVLPAAPEDGASEAQAIANAARGWFFKLSDADAATLQQKRADFLAPAGE